MNRLIDTHNHLGVRPGAAQSVEELLRRMDRGGVAQCFVFPFPEVGDNSYVARAARSHLDRLIAFGTVNPWLTEAVEEARRCFEVFGMRGLYLNPVRHGYPADRRVLLDPILDLCAAAGGHVIVHCTSDSPFSGAYQIEVLAQAFKTVTFQLAHMGMIWSTNQAITVASRNPNVYLGTAGVSLLAVRKAAEEAGAEKILWGSDTPFNEFEVERLKIELAVQNREAYELITGDNAYRLVHHRTR